MEQVANVRDFKVRGNYFTQRSLIFRQSIHHSSRDKLVASRPGYSPPEVDIEFEDGRANTIVVSEVDIPILCEKDFESAKRYLSLILAARSGDSTACSELVTTAERHPRLSKQGKQPPTETEFVVACTSAEAHTAEDISQKGAILLNLGQAGYPVPDFVVLTAQTYLDRERHLETHIADAVAQLEILTLQELGSSQDPLVFAVRCATPRYIPGVMDTYLNVGVTENTLPGLETLYGTAVARRMFLNNLKNICILLGCGQKADLVNVASASLGPNESARMLDQLVAKISKIDRKLVEDAHSQLTFFVRRGYEDFEENRELVLTLCRGSQHYPSLILQKMVCSIRHADAYAGVVCSRHTQTGKGVELQTANNIFGEEIMTGSAEVETTSFKDRREIKNSFPAVYHFVPHLAKLETEFQSPVTIEFAVEATNRYQWFALLQLNETGMAGRAALASAIDLHKAGTISRKRVTELIRPYHIKQLSSDTIDEDSFSFLTSFCTGVAVLPRSAVSARIYFSSEAALKAKSGGEKACLCKQTFIPNDTVVMREMDAIVSLTPVAIHVVTICQSLGIPALLSVEKNGAILDDRGLVNSAGRVLREGDWITISSRRRVVYEGQAKFKPARLLRYMQGEDVEFAPGEREVFDSTAYNYRLYQQLIKSLTVDQISTLDEITRLVNVEMRSNPEEAAALVNNWFDEHKDLYIAALFKSDIGDHLTQSRVFDLFTLERKIRFFKLALEKCSRERISGYQAGAFMLGRFLASRYPVVFWKSFSPLEVALMVNEWVLFEKYMQLLHDMGERKLLQARKKILQEGLDPLHVRPGNVKCLISVKLAGIALDEAKQSMPEWTDAQTIKVIELLQHPYREFYDYRARWSLAELERICNEDKIAVPQPDDA